MSGESWDDDSIMEWLHPRKTEYLKLTNEIFDDQGRLKIFTESEWDDAWIQIVEYKEDNGSEEPRDTDDEF